jgi:hypothetical protein
MNFEDLDKLLYTAGVTTQLNEARIPGVEYEEKKTKGVVSRVIAQMVSYMGGSWTRLNNRYMKLEFQLKRLEEARNKLNLQITDKIQRDTFDPSDELYTRVVETKDAIFTLAKRTMKTKADKVDRKAIIADMPKELLTRLDFLTDDMLPELTKAIELVVEKHTTTYEPEETKPALRPKRKTKFDMEESINEDATSRFEQLFQKFFAQYDEKLDYVTDV